MTNAPNQSPNPAEERPPRQAERSSAERTDASRRHFYQVWMCIGIVALLYVLGIVLDVLATPVAIVVWTVVIVLCLRAPVEKLEAHGVPRVIGTAIAYLGMFVLVGGLAAVMFSPAFGFGDQFANIAASLPGYVQGLTDWTSSLYERYASVLQNETVREWIDSASKAMLQWASATASASASGVFIFGAGVANSVMIVGFALVVAFWILMELPAIGREASRIIPPHRREDAEMLHLTFTRVMGGYLKATIAQCVIIGLACGIGFTIIGIPNASALGLITGVLNIIPVVGPWIGGAAAAVIALFAGPWMAAIALVFTIVVQQFVYTFISPKLMANSVDVHPALVIVVLLVGSAVGNAMAGLMGSIVGMLLSIPLAAIAKSIFVFYFEKKTGRQVVAEDGVFFQGTPSHLDDEATVPNAIADAVSPAVRPDLPNFDPAQAAAMFFGKKPADAKKPEKQPDGKAANEEQAPDAEGAFADCASDARAARVGEAGEASAASAEEASAVGACASEEASAVGGFAGESAAQQPSAGEKPSE